MKKLLSLTLAGICAFAFAAAADAATAVRVKAPTTQKGTVTNIGSGRVDIKHVNTTWTSSAKNYANKYNGKFEVTSLFSNDLLNSQLVYDDLRNALTDDVYSRLVPAVAGESTSVSTAWISTGSNINSYTSDFSGKTFAANQLIDPAAGNNFGSISSIASQVIPGRTASLNSGNITGSNLNDIVNQTSGKTYTQEEAQKERSKMYEAFLADEANNAASWNAQQNANAKAVQAKIAELQQTLDAYLAEKAALQAALDSAEAAYDKAVKEQASAESALANAEKNQAAVAEQNSDAVSAAQDAYDSAQTELKSAQTAYEAAKAEVSAAQAAVNAFNTPILGEGEDNIPGISSGDSEELAAAETALLNAQTALANAEANLSSAQAAASSAAASLSSAQESQSSANSSASSQVDAAQDAADKAKIDAQAKSKSKTAAESALSAHNAKYSSLMAQLKSELTSFINGLTDVNGNAYDVSKIAGYAELDFNQVAYQGLQYQRAVFEEPNFNIVNEGSEVKGNTITTTVGVSYGDQEYAMIDGVLTKVINVDTETFKTSVYIQEGTKTVSPLVLDMTGNGVLQASNGQHMPGHDYVATNNIIGDFFGDGFEIAMEWVGPQDGLLVAPKADGSVDLSCLFGTAGGYDTGYEKLSLYDKNNDSKVSGSELDGLSVWQDANTNGIAEAGEVKTVQALGITSIALSDSSDFISSFERNGRTYKMWDWWPNAVELIKVAAK